MKTTGWCMKDFAILAGAVSAWVSAAAGYPADAVLDVTRPPYAVVPDDGQDDAAAIQRAVSENLDRGVALFFPNGVYDLDQGIVFRDTKGKWRPHVAIRGESREGTVFRLREQAAGMQDAANPRGVFTTGSFWEPGDHESGGGNKAFRNNFSDFTLDTGRGNPGALFSSAIAEDGSARKGDAAVIVRGPTAPGASSSRTRFCPGGCFAGRTWRRSSSIPRTGRGTAPSRRS